MPLIIKTERKLTGAKMAYAPAGIFTLIYFFEHQSGAQPERYVRVGE